jgi:DNA-binding MarR family transcriptional regulator
MDDHLMEAHAKQSLRVWIRLLRATTLIEKAVRSHLRIRCATTLPRFDVLSALDRAGAELTMSELSERLLVSNGNVTGVIARLIEEGFVGRQTDPSDRRVHRVFLTQSGRLAFRHLAQEHEALIDHIMAGFGESEMEQLLDLTATLEESARRELGTLDGASAGPHRQDREG